MIVRRRQLHEPVGAGQGQKVARVLRRCGPRLQRAAGRLQQHRQEQGQRRPEPYRLGQCRELHRRGSRSLGGLEEWHHVAAQTRHHRNRIAGQREHPLAGAGAADPQRLAGPLAHAVQVALHAQTREHSRQEVGAALRHGAGGDQHVVLAQGVTHAGREPGGVIGQMAGIHLVAQGGQRRRHGIAVGTPYLVRRDRLAHVDQLVAGGDHGHPRAPADRHLGTAHRGQDGDVRRRDAPAGGKHRGAGAGVGALPVHVLSGHDGRLRLQPRAFAIQAQVLAADHRVAAGRQHGSRHDPQRAVVAVAQRLARLAGARLGLQAQGALPPLQGAGGDGDAVHGDAVVGRQVAVRQHRFAQHTAHRRHQRALLRRERHGTGGQETVDVGDGIHGVVVPPAYCRAPARVNERASRELAAGNATAVVKALLRALPD